MSTLKRLILLAVILITVGLIGSLFTVKSLFQSSELVTEEQIYNESYEDIVINIDNMNVQLYGSKEKETKIVTSTKEKNKANFQINEGILTITVAEPDSLRFTLPNFGLINRVPSVKIYVPEDIYKRINIKSKNGMITAKDLEAEDIVVETINGLVKLESIKSHKTKITTENGLVNLNQMSGDIVSQTTNGKISYKATHIDQNIDFKTVNGLISIETENEPTNVTFDVAVELGQVDIFGSNEQNVVYGAGENAIKLTTSLGKITVKE